MEDDKRRIPYNIWINVLGAIFFLLIASVGVFVFDIGLRADQRAVTNKERCNYNSWCEYKYEYDYGIETKGDWRDVICRILMALVGIAIIILGVIVWVHYARNHYWEKGDKCKLK